MLLSSPTTSTSSTGTSWPPPSSTMLSTSLAAAELGSLPGWGASGLGGECPDDEYAREPEFRGGFVLCPWGVFFVRASMRRARRAVAVRKAVALKKKKKK